MSKTKEQKCEQRWIKHILKNKRGKLIRIRCWTEENGSYAETHTKTMTAAVKFVNQHGSAHANWVMELISEQPNLVPSGLHRCKQCGWRHEINDECVPRV